MGKLIIIASPIGNLKDITVRALEVLREADLILAEDTRTTKKLLSHYDIHYKELWSFFEGNEKAQTSHVLERLNAGDTVALVSESGTPLVSDPGFDLVREVIKYAIPIETFPGPTAAIAALTVSGLPPDKFLFLGFLPKKKGKKKSLLEEVRKMLDQTKNVLNPTIIFYESPYRLISTLVQLKEIFGDIQVVVCRELTKLHEEIRREKISDSIAHFKEVTPQGEFTVLVHQST